ncbi:hypothetical protein [Enhygromyxa salina]|uniref:Uncharacterized protein n=1 Tax=Enhygromyxa salina TaxID=215803 RepID=A0A2S9YDI8_9BACT|nr:hypothetical protein [Enhygromyxa salina]PRQ03187.1 hypothetical protein ENSA7_53270 [Enhygromyxa salina]
MAHADQAALLDQGRQAIAAIVNLASICPAGGDARWDAMLAKLNVTPLPPDERARHLREGPGQAKGALLLELRWALNGVVAPLCEHMDEGWRLTHEVEQAVRDYVGAVKPRVTTASIFANALAGAASSPAAMVGAAGASADCCRCCGAPRAERGETHCHYCGESR